jgi:hypothetical protein
MVPPKMTSILTRSSHQLTLILCLALAVLTLGVYWEVQDHDFVDYDDQEYIVQNPRVRSGLTLEGLTWALTTPHANNWHPLTWLSHMLDADLYGLNPKGHHWSSVVLHIANAILWFLLFKRMTGAQWESAFVAALFAIHPLHVESVAWVSERKDVLSTFFWIMTLWTYVGYTGSPGLWRYGICLFLFTLGLLAKPMLVTLPFVMLLLDYWPLRRLSFDAPRGQSRWHLLLHLTGEKTPFFVLAACSSIITFLVQEGSGAVVSVIPLQIRLANAIVSFGGYIIQMFWPLNLACFYPHPYDALPAWKMTASFLFLMAFSFLTVRAARKSPYLLVGWLWYLGTLIPVIGIVQVGAQAMADRYTYVPLIGLFIMISWGVPEVWGKGHYRRTLLPILSGSLLCCLLLLARQQVGYWRHTISLFEHEIQITRDSYLGHFHLASGLEQQGRLAEAHDHLSEALRIRPGFDLAHYHMGNVLTRLGKLDEAIDHYSRALKLNPGDGKVHNNMGFVLLRQGKAREALHHFTEALRLDPEDALARHNRGVALRKSSESGPR